MLVVEQGPLNEGVGHPTLYDSSANDRRMAQNRKTQLQAASLGYFSKERFPTYLFNDEILKIKEGYCIVSINMALYTPCSISFNQFHRSVGL